ncbi:MAG TPA: hypothetical protein PLS10_07130 [Chitinophagales bacterium]|nr:hypothetical protein [Chitinophagales bacterium]
MKKSNTITTLNEAIADAIRVKTANNMPFATIWKTGKSYGFNFEKKEIGFTTNEYNVKRIVIAIV